LELKSFLAIKRVNELRKINLELEMSGIGLGGWLIFGAIHSSSKVDIYKHSNPKYNKSN
jgi:hypothetical protein